jgi:uncharacterized repeat protein (TIGR01451 family)
MRNKACIFAFIFVISLGLTLAWVLGARVSMGTAATQAELHVCPSGCAYDNVQEAVDAANEGDVIKVAEGTYTGVSEREGVTQTVYLSKTLTIQGGYTTSDWDDPDPEGNITTLDAQGQGRVFFIQGENTYPTIAGLHITGGVGMSAGDVDGDGGGIYADSGCCDGVTSLLDNHIYGNSALTYNGGGINLQGYAHYTLTGNTFENNTAADRGGGMNAGAKAVLTLTDNLFTGNSAYKGGGLAVDFYAVANLRGNIYRDNHAESAGGGLYAYRNDVLVFDGELFIGNSASYGGGVYFSSRADFQYDSWMANTLIADNQASMEGAGIYIAGGLLRLQHTTLSGNSGGEGSAIAVGDWTPGDPVEMASNLVLQNTILANQALGLHVSDASTLAVDSILWHNVAVTLTEAPEASVSLVNQLTGDPLFADPANDDYHLTGASAARDVGVNAGVFNDFDGLLRPMGFGFDLGAYEYEDAALSLSKTPHLSGANVGEEITYQIVLTSSGTQDTHHVVLTDTLDGWQRATAVESPDGNCTITDPDWGGTVVCEPGDLNIGDVIEVQLAVEVDAEALLGQELINTLTAHSDEAANDTQTVLYAQDCHVRIGDNTKTYTSVQAAVDEAYAYALVKVAGTCMGVYGPEDARQQVYIDQALTVQGGYTTSNWTTPDPEASPTTLDARGLGRVMYILKADWQETMDVLIDGLQLTGGSSYGQMGGHDPLEKYASEGGGVYVYGAEPLFSNDHIYGNTSQNSGGGVFGSFAFLSFHGSTINDNVALADGGGVAVHAEGSSFIDTRFEGNRAKNGGGFAAAVVGGGRFVRSTFIGNHATGFGGGLALETAAWLNETLILSNTADEQGGGIGFYGMSPFSPYAVLTNTVIADNQAGLQGAGMFIPSGIAVHLNHTTLARNTGGDGSGITLGWYDWMSPGVSTLAMTDTIVAYQDVGIQVSDASTVTVAGVLWFANSSNVWQSEDATVWKWSEVTGNPYFVNPDGGDYHIGENSAARNTGLPSGVTLDLDGEIRPMGGFWDLGADEYFELWFSLPLVFKN